MIQRRLEMDSTVLRRSVIAFLTLLLMLSLTSCPSLIGPDPSLPDKPEYRDNEAPHIAPIDLSFSHHAGFYTESFDLVLESEIPGAVIYYTLDGSSPNPAHVMTDSQWEALVSRDDLNTSHSRSFIYTAPLQVGQLIDRPNDISRIPTNLIPVDGGFARYAWRLPPEQPKALVVRARAIADRVTSREFTHSYFIEDQGRDRYSLPVVSISTDREHFFDYDHGIYVPGARADYSKDDPDIGAGNWRGRGDNWERPAHFELFENDGSRPLAQNIGIRIHGGHSRRLPQKSLRLYARTDYGPGSFSYQVFESREVDEFNRLILRNAGQDYGRALLRDAVAQTLVQHLSVDTQHYRPTIVFINGEYWGIQALRERQDQHYIEAIHDIAANDITMLELEGRILHGSTAVRDEYLQMVEQIKRKRLSPEEIRKRIDIPQYLDYLIFQLYSTNTDWPFNNIQYWRYNGPQNGGSLRPDDGRWRWLIFDMDWTFDYHRWTDIFGPINNQHEINMIEYILDTDEGVWGGERGWSRDLIRGILEIDEFRQEFIQRLAVHLSTTFHPERVISHIDSLADLLRPEIHGHSQRWSRPISIQSWNSELNRMKTFAEHRPDSFRQHVVEYFPEAKESSEFNISFD